MSSHEGNWGDLLSGKNAARSAALSGGVALHAINIYIATTVLPSVVQEIGGLNLYAWNTTLFVVASILGSALTSRTLNRTGSRGAYMVAIMLFLAGSLLCALAPSMLVMLLGRTVQGLGGGFLFALGYAMIYEVFEKSLWPRAFALVSGMWGVATLIGPAIGGIFADINAWRMAFGFLVPVSLLYAWLIWRALPADGHERGPAAPLPGIQLLLLTAAVLAISLGSTKAELSYNLLGVGVTVILVAILVGRERQGGAGLLPRNALRLHSPLLMLYLTIGLLVIGMTSETFVPYFLQHLHGQSPLMSGYLAALMAAGWTLAEVWSSGWQGKRITLAIVIGPVLVLAGMVMLALATPVQSAGGIMLLVAISLALLLVGFGIGIGWPHLLTRVLEVTPAEDQDAAATSISTVQLFATALGAALSGMLANMGGLNVPGGTEGAISASRVLFGVLALAPLLAIYTASRAAKTQ
nr:MFS transporter [uncultured Erwinia sp.]